MSRPNISDFETAAAWLECNDGGDGEETSCANVAAWLRKQAEADADKAEARFLKITVPQLRAAKVRINSQHKG